MPDAPRTRPHSNTSPSSTPRPQTEVSAAVGVVAGVTTFWAAALGAAIALSNWATPGLPAAQPKHHITLAAGRPGPMLDEKLVAEGRSVFMTTCAKCHADDAAGRPDLGKDLVHSDFVAMRDDAALRAFIVRGRDIGDPLNTSRTAMPPKGSDASMTGAEVDAVVAYVRGLQDPRRLPMLKAWSPDDLDLAMAKMKTKAKECMSAEAADGLDEQFELARGACCASGGGCIQSTLADCGFARTWIIGQACSPNPCAPGACCLLSTGACSSTLYTECPGIASWAQGRACQPNPCGDPRRGVCCHGDGSCTVQLRDMCPGEFTPNLAACAPTTCPQPTGACCSDRGACAIATRAVCEAVGTYRGHGTLCQPAQCEPVARAARR